MPVLPKSFGCMMKFVGLHFPFRWSVPKRKFHCTRFFVWVQTNDLTYEKNTAIRIGKKKKNMQYERIGTRA